MIYDHRVTQLEKNTSQIAISSSYKGKNRIVKLF